MILDVKAMPKSTTGLHFDFIKNKLRTGLLFEVNSKNKGDADEYHCSS